jgi:hypothetical protein
LPCSQASFHIQSAVLSDDKTGDAKYKYMSAPSPPKLAPEQQKEWDELIKKASQASDEAVNAAAEMLKTSMSASATEAATSQLLHPNMRKGPAPEFEGDTNPKTGEIGGPKSEPLRWGSKGDYSYGGRVTDF